MNRFPISNWPGEFVQLVWLNEKIFRTRTSVCDVCFRRDGESCGECLTIVNQAEYLFDDPVDCYLLCSI